MKNIATTILFFLSLSLFAQQKITLDECYQLVSKNYPLIKKNILLENQNALNLEVIGTEKNPKVDFSAQATYQSDVIELPIATATPLNKDQYRVTLTVNQLIYAGGIIDAKVKLTNAELDADKKQVEVQMYHLKKRINQLYFSILLTQEKYNLLDVKKTLLDTKLKEVRSGIKNGMVLPTSDKLIQAELYKISQQFTEIRLNKESLMNSLSAFIGKELNPSTDFIQPLINKNISPIIKRPELDLFQLKKEKIKESEHILSKENLPKFFAFANGGFGNPGLNMLDNSFQSFYTVGVKLNWNVFDWNANKKKRKLLFINNDIIDNEKEIFELNTNIELSQQQTEIKKLISFIASDLKIIQLRIEVLASAESQVQNGVITASAYMTELTALYEDKDNLNTHKIQLLLVKANYNVTKGH